jgi:hypothetical protein
MKTFVSIILLVVAVASAHAQSTAAEREELTRAAEEVLRPGTFALFIVPPSTGPLNESVVSGLSLFGGPSALVKSAVRTLRECKRRTLDLAVACKTEAKGRATMLAALKSLNDERLEGMTIYYLIPPDAELAKKTEALGAKPVFKKPNQSTTDNFGAAPRRV